MRKNINNYIIIIILICIITFLIYNFRKSNENFDNCSCSNNNNSNQEFDYGIEKIVIDSSYNDTTPRLIKFHKKFSKIPQVFTQIISNDPNNIDNIMTVNVMDNITSQDFNYIIRGVSNKNVGADGKMKVLSINNSLPVSFYWMAIG